MSSGEQQLEQTVVIVGVGLIGGSVALALRAATPSTRVIGIGRNANRLQKAVADGLIDEFASELLPEHGVRAGLGVICLPVDRIPAAADQLLSAGCDVVTDAGSVKQSICTQMSTRAGFVGAHPIAGSEQSGFEHAVHDLFRGRICVVCREDTEYEAVQRTLAFWQLLGMTCRVMSPAQHDRVLAMTSHLPHILASVAAGCVTRDQLEFVGTGFRDTTRIAAGSDELWTSILMDNAPSCMAAVDLALERLSQFRTALGGGEASAIRQLLSEAALLRRSLTELE